MWRLQTGAGDTIKRFGTLSWREGPGGLAGSSWVSSPSNKFIMFTVSLTDQLSLISADFSPLTALHWEGCWEAVTL